MQLFNNTLKQIISFTSRSSDRKPDSKPANNYDSKVLCKINSIRNTPKREHNVFNKLFRHSSLINHRAIINNYQNKQADIVSGKDNQDRIIEGSNQSILKRALYSNKSTPEYKCSNSSLSYLKFLRNTRKRRGQGTRLQRRVILIRSATYTNTTKKSHGDLKYSTMYVDGDCLNENTSRNSSKFVKVNEMEHTKSKIVQQCIQTSKLCALSSKLRNCKGIMNFTSNGTGNDIQSQRHQFAQNTFFTMNLQVQQDKRHKLLPYECEPGICIPGQCNPIECAKLIKKRLKKSSSTTTTDIMTSASTTTPVPKNKKNDHKKKNATDKGNKNSGPRPQFSPNGNGQHHPPPGKKTTTNQRRSSSAGKQAVRIKSSFSFDIEFSKSAFEGPKQRGIGGVPTSKAREKQLRAQGVHGNQNYSHNAQSQSNVKVYNKALMKKVKDKRCFCTLELNPTKLQHKGINIKMKGVPDNAITMASVGQNTKKVKTPKLKYDESYQLEPYECEPGFCIPGQCDPHKCLERIHKRSIKKADHMQHLQPYEYECEPGFCTPGECDPHKCFERIKKRSYDTKKTGTVAHSQSTASSLTLQKKNKDKPKKKGQKQDKIKAADTETTDSNSMDSNRHAVRVGSSFNFNVEFYTDKSFTDQSSYQNKEQRSKEIDRGTKEKNSTKKQANGKKINPKLKNTQEFLSADTSTQDIKATKDQRGQVKAHTADKSVKAAGFIERCFCTAKLFGAQVKDTKSKTRRRRRAPAKDTIPNKIAHEENETQGKPVRKTKSTKVSNKDKRKPQGKRSVHGAIKNTSNKYDLEPYECEPGVCIPGKCNPHECEKLIKKRLNRDAGTKMHKAVLSVSSVTDTNHADKEVNKTKGNGAQKKQPSKKNDKQTVQKQNHLKQPSYNNRNNKKAVSIGSSFSFNVEFSKGLRRKPLVPTTGTHNLISKYDQEYFQDNNKTKKTTDKSKPNATGHWSQQSHTGFAHTKVDKKMKSKGAGDSKNYMAAGNATDRCFCTLTLQNAGTQRKSKIILNAKNTLAETSVSAKMKNHIMYKETGTKARKNQPYLEPYYCEPGVCVPGKCVPKECFKRIKKLNPPKAPPANSTSSVTGGDGGGDKIKSRRRGKCRYDPDVNKCHEIVEQPRALHPSNWQRVKIGSNFTFNAEFYKELIPPTVQPSLVTEEIKGAKKIKKGKGTGNHNKVIDSDVQVKHLTESKGSTAGKALKRCFCTSRFHPINSKNHYKQSITVGRVETIHNTPLPCYKSTYCKQKCHNTATNTRPAKFVLPKTNLNLNFSKINFWLRNKVDNVKKHVLHKVCDESQAELAEWYTVMNVSGVDLTNDISIEGDEDNKNTVMTVGGTGIGCRINRAYLPRATTNKHKVKPNVVQDTKLSNSKPLKKEVKSKREIDRYCVQSKTAMTKVCANRKRKIGRHAKKIKYSNKNHSSDSNVSQMETILPPQSMKKCCCHPSVLKTKIRSKKNRYKHDIKEQSDPHQEIDYDRDLKKSRSERGPQKSPSILRTSKSWKIDHNKPQKRVLNKNMHENSNRPDKKVKFDLSDSGPLRNKYGDGNSFLNPQTILKNIVSITNNLERIKQLFGIKKSEEYTEVKIRGKKMKKDICVPKNPADRTLVTVSGAYIGCDVNKKAAGDSNAIKSAVRPRPTDGSCTATCASCKDINTNNFLFDAMSTRVTPKHDALCRCRRCKCPKKKNSLSKELGVKFILAAKRKAKGGKKDTKHKSSFISPASKKRMLKKMSKRRQMIEKRINIMGQKESKRRKLFLSEDSMRLVKRRLKNTERMEHVKHSAKSSDVALVAESLLDIGRLGCVTVSDVLRSTWRQLHNPITAVRGVKHGIAHPTVCYQTTKKAVEASGLVPTLKRVQLRILHTKMFKAFKVIMDSNPITGYIMHMFEDNPKKRLKLMQELRKKKAKESRMKKRAPDFGCNMFMGSLRKRPCLKVYYMCPWFYPHFLSLLTLWRQLVEITLFLLAVVVWSPCLFMIEVFRLFVCCGLCTA